jgi:hypothetical protein
MLSGSTGGAGYYIPGTPNVARFVNFNPYLPDATEFDNSAFNPLINNATESVKNTYIMNVEYNNGAVVPSNLPQILAQTAQKARVPDSNYTTTRIINPRYEGCTIQSANYNTFTPPGEITFLNAFVSGSSDPSVTGSSWDGDNSYGNTSVIDVNPKFFAHFKSSKENLEKFGTYTFRIDSLIQVPTVDITGTKAPETPVVLNVNGSNDNLAEVRSTFEVDRGVAVAYRSSKFGGVDYSSLKVGDTPIFQGAVEYQTIMTSEPSRGTFCTTQSFITNSFSDIVGYASGSGLNPLPPITAPSRSYYVGPDTNQDSLLLFGISGSDHNLATGSNCFYLRGGYAAISASQGIQPTNPASGSPAIMAATYIGNFLALAHNFNQYVRRGIIATGSSFFPYAGASGSNQALPGIPSGSKFDASSSDAYMYLQYSQSTDNFTQSLLGYENYNQPFVVEVGDEIRCTYNLGTDANPEVTSTDFVVTAVDPNTDYELQVGAYNFSPSGSLVGVNANATLAGVIQAITSSRYNYDKITVNPDPSTFKIPDGKVFGFTIRRRVNADDRVIVFQEAPTGSRGLFTPTGDGYLIPNDFSPQQKRNVLTIINQLNAKNAYREDPDQLRSIE